MKSADWARRILALDPKYGCLIKAPAGSGKTELLTARYLALLAGGGPRGGPCNPGQILAVTFTDKAAVEMKSRIAFWLSKAADPSYAPEPSEDWKLEILGHARKALEAHRDAPDLLRNPTAYRVGTFHSFCASVCRAWPVESGIPVNADILPNHRQETILAEAVRSLLADLRRRGGRDECRQALERRLAALGNSSRRLSGQLAGLLKERHKLRQFQVAVGEGAEDAREALEGFLQEYLRPVLNGFREPGSFGRALSAGEPPEDGEALPREVPPSDFASVPTWVRVARCLLTKSKGLRASCKKAIGDGSGAEAMAERLKLFYDLDPAPESCLPDGQALADYLLLAEEALEHLRPLIPGEGLDYLELELGASRALENVDGIPSESLIFFHEHLRHILVDEAQDMNRAQLDLLGFLTEGWEPDEPGDPRTVFVVGDPKQSIYRFRRAEVALFDELEKFGIRRDGSEGPFPFGRCLELESNFRSSEGLVRFANDLFSRIMADPDPRQDEVPFGPGKAELARAGHDPELRIAQFADPAKAGARSREREIARTLAPDRREARWVAAEVAGLHAQKPGDTIGILLPRRTRLDAYVAALRERDVPVKMVEGENLGAKPEVVHLHNLFKALARPYDDVAWAGALRAPWYRVSEGVLHELATSGELGAAWSGRITSSEHPAVKSFADALKPSKADFGREPFHRTLLRSWERLGGPAAVASRYGTAGVGNCLAYLDLLAECENQSAEEAIALVEYRFEEAYTPPDPAAATSPVQLMTIHRAKGLEFDHVFAAYLGYRPGRGDSRDRPPFLLLDLPNTGGTRVPCAATERDARVTENRLPHALLTAVDRMRDQAEVKRLLYVAATRAKKSLTLTGCGKIEKDSFAAPPKSPMSLIVSAIGESGPALAERVLLNPDLGEASPASGAQARPPSEEREPSPVSPLMAFSLPYVTRSPSEKLDAEEDQAKPGGEDEDRVEGDDTPAILGRVVHRLLEKLAREGKGARLPSAVAVAVALRSEGLDAARAREYAPGILREAEAAWEDPAFAAIREGGDLRPEWGVEHVQPGDRGERCVVMTGRLDLAVVTDHEVFIVDYKTGRRAADKSPADFKAEMREHYGPQLRRYEAMLAVLTPFAGRTVRSFLLLTDLPGERLIQASL